MHMQTEHGSKLRLLVVEATRPDSHDTGVVSMTSFSFSSRLHHHPHRDVMVTLQISRSKLLNFFCKHS
jgi:hypothetical protein